MKWISFTRPMRLKNHMMRVIVPLLAALTAFCSGLAPSASAASTPSFPDAGGSSDSAPTGSESRAPGAQPYTGQAFDTCQAPSLETMRAWRSSSPFGGVGIYFGGRGRACPQPNLDSSWTREVHRMGWRVLPVYVGSQSPCVSAKNKQAVRMSSSRAGEQGRSEGQDAVRQAAALGMRAKSALYLDMEAYNWRDTGCADATRRFVQGWNRTVRASGYLPGFYSSAESGVRHMENLRQLGVPDLPQAMWFARWHRQPAVDSEPALGPSAWQPHARVHQFDGNVSRSYGGQTMTVDRNAVDAPVAVFG